MKRHCNLTPDSMFIDVGAGLGKPNIHVACDPGVKFSYGIEVERTRWLLSLANMRGILKDTLKSPELWTQVRGGEGRKGKGGDDKTPETNIKLPTKPTNPPHPPPGPQHLPRRKEHLPSIELQPVHTRVHV